jgi:hypothetical protein
MIAKILQLLNENFLEQGSWYASFDYDGVLNKDELDKFLHKKLVEVIDLFVESILLGEYEKEANFEEVLSDLQSKSSAIYGNLVSELIEDIDLLKSTEEFVKGFHISSR